MSLFDYLKRKVSNIHDKRQAAHYRKVRFETRKLQLQKAKLERVREANKSKRRLQREIDHLSPKSKKRKFRMPKVVGDLNALTKGMPSDAQLNSAIFGSPSPKAPKGVRNKSSKGVL